MYLGRPKFTKLEFATSFLLNQNDPKGLEQFLLASNFFREGEKLEHVAVAGEGNMNVVLRATTNQRSFIVKQSRPWVNKYPSVPAPVGRIARENEFYELVRKIAVIRKHTPEIYFYDATNYIICMEDFGPANDFSTIYQKGETVSKGHMADIARVVSELHFVCRDLPASKRIQNLELRQLNHQHIFDLPLNKNSGFDLDGVLLGLHSKTEKFRTDERLRKSALELGEVYLSDQGNRLLHGDYYPGSWLSTSSGFKMIDPEFCFTGKPEFELAVAVAHLKMAQQPDSLIKDLFVYYHFDERFDGTLFSKFAGMEIIRRIIGLAQLPLDLNLQERLDLLDEAYELVVNG